MDLEQFKELPLSLGNARATFPVDLCLGVRDFEYIASAVPNALRSPSDICDTWEERNNLRISNLARVSDQNLCVIAQEIRCKKGRMGGRHCDSSVPIAAKKHPGVSTEIYSIDFSKNDEVAYQNLSAVLSDRDVGVLVNNVGKSHAMPVYLVDTPKEEMADIVAINVNATLRVTYAILPGMVQRKRGLILNIGSFAGAIPSPMLAVYSGTKAFLATFTSALAEEVRAHNITVEHVSKLSKIRKASMLIPEPGPYVRSVLSKISLACGAAYSGRPGTSTPYWSHALLDYAMTVIGLPSLFISYTHKLHKNIRKRALRKQEREAKRL
ncbi:hypothetical protein C0989_009888 [Termitomyces sp. Mn162]|nr:hypothetical protein C0989_009888 [Termitomyces sp. Mn162]